jgi:hypothetical protein
LVTVEEGPALGTFKLAGSLNKVPKPEEIKVVRNEEKLQKEEKTEASLK